MGEDTDAVVIETSLTRPAAFGTIFDRHATVLHRYLVRRLGPDEADTMVGEIFRIAFERRHTFDLDRSSARPWLYGIATNLLAKHRRREARRIRATARLAASRLPAIDPTDRVSSDLDAVDRWGRIAQAVTELPPAERDALMLYAWEGLSYEDVAVALGIPPGTVRSRLHRARGRLRDLEGVRGEEPDDNDIREPGRIGS